MTFTGETGYTSSQEEAQNASRNFSTAVRTGDLGAHDSGGKRQQPEGEVTLKRALWGFVGLWVTFMLVIAAWGDWRRAVILLLFPFAFLVANLIAIPVCILAGVLYGFWKATGRSLGISVEVI